MKVVKPALLCRFPTKSGFYFLLDLLDDGPGNGYETVCGARYPIKPVIKDPDQAVVAELGMGQRYEIVDHRDDVDTFGLELLGHRKEVGMPGRVQQYQYIAGLAFELLEPVGIHVIEGGPGQAFHGD